MNFSKAKRQLAQNFFEFFFPNLVEKAEKVCYNESTRKLTREMAQWESNHTNISSSKRQRARR